MLVVHLALLGLATSALAAAGLRASCRLATPLSARLLGAAGIGASAAMLEALLLGLAGQGTSPWWLTMAAVATWLAMRLLVAAPATPPRRQIAQCWQEWSPGGRGAVGAGVALALGIFVFELFRPTIGLDGLTYHAAQPVVWLTGGRPGSLHQTMANFPTQAYPKTMELLVSWAYSIGRSPVAAVPLTVGLQVLVAAAVVTGLRRVGVAGWVAILAAVAGLLLPINMREANGIFSDVPALAWLATSVALSVAALEEPAAIGLAAVAGGLAIGTKPTSAPLVLIALAWALWVHRRSLWGARAVLALPVAVSLVTGGIWYVVDWHAYGSPLWPFSRFPSGRPVPTIWREYGARFLHDPVASYHAVGHQPYVLYLAGGLVLMAAVPTLTAAALLPAGRPVRRVLVVGLALVLVETLLWSDSEFTGIANGNGFVVFSGLRYLIPAPLAAAVVLALVTRARTAYRWLAVAALGLAVALNIWELRRADFAFPLRPNAEAVVAMLVVGTVAASLFAATGAVRRLSSSVHLGLAGAVAVVGIGALMAVPASRFVADYLQVGRQHGFADTPILRYLDRQPGWRHGSAPVAVGNAVYMTFAGPQFQHPLSYVPESESCAAVQAAARRGWLILTPLRHQPFAAMNYTAPLRCMAGVAPVARLAGGTRVYAPAGLTAS